MATTEGDFRQLADAMEAVHQFTVKQANVSEAEYAYLDGRMRAVEAQTAAATAANRTFAKFIVIVEMKVGKENI